ncbi:MAG: hypothetical protein B6A08_14255 [Sorangiineae bacterium NIC37A_2]|nr:MAG: hypothetical protein B6A08_14255 [Sorangiineae bacterium NIC37A_2]
MIPVGSARVIPYGLSGVLVDLGIAEHPARANLTQAAVRALMRALPEKEIVSGAGTIGVFGGAAGGTTLDASALEAALASDLAEPAPGRLHEIPVVYDGPDLEPLAEQLRLSARELIELHTSQELTCELVGFMPGFGYLGPNVERLEVPRRASPRPRVPAGSVALAGAYTGIYPFESPGGWHLLGRSLGPPLFDVKRAEPNLFAPGDRVRFVSVQSGTPRTGRILDLRFSLRGPRRAGLSVVSGPALMTLQDGGRPGNLARGLPSSGPLSPLGYQRAVAPFSGASGSAAALEIVGGPARFQARGTLWVALDGEGPRRLADGETLEVPTGAGWARYLAIEGGFEADLVLGSSSTLLLAGLGGYSGRTLRRGDFVAQRNLAAARELSQGRLLEGGRDEQIFIEPGPHIDLFAEGAFERLVESEYRVSELSNRVGKRLEGPKVERRFRDTLLPTPMIRGAIEVPASGEPIVLGPDHPTTGGYPVLAVVRPESWDRFGALRPGENVRFGTLGRRARA